MRLEVMSKLPNLHKFWGSYQINNCSKTLYIKTRLRQIEVSSFPNIDSSKIGTFIFQRKTNLVIGEYLAGLLDLLLIVFFLSGLPSESSFRWSPERSVYWFCAVLVGAVCGKGRFVFGKFIFFKQKTVWFEQDQRPQAQAIKRVGMLPVIPTMIASQHLSCNCLPSNTSNPWQPPWQS